MPGDSRPEAAAESTPRDERGALLTATIEACRRQLTHGALLFRLLHVLAGAAVFPLVVVIADHALPGGLPQAVIFGAGILWVLLTCLAAAGVSIRTTFRRLNTLFVARHVERSHGIAHNPLINMVLLQRAPQARYARDVAVRQAASVLAASSSDSSRSGVSLRRPGLLLLAAVGLWLVYTAITPKPILPSLARLFGSDRPAPTATRLELVHPRPDEPVYIGEPLEIVFAVLGRPVAEVWFELRDPAEPEAPPRLRSSLQRSEDSEAAQHRRVLLAAHEVPGDLHYRCTAGDAVAEGVIAVQPRPDLAELEIELVPPAYVDEPTRRTTEPDLDIWAGTRAAFVVLANTDVLDPVFVFRGKTETRTRMSVDPAQPHCTVLSLSLIESGDYWIEFSDRWGRRCEDPATHRIVARHDAPPWVEITAPNAEEAPGDVVDVTHVPWLRAVAADDVRLDVVSLVREADGVVSRVDLLESEVAARGRSVEVGVATSDLSLEVGQSLRVWFEARDNHALLDATPAPQTGRSPVLTLIRSPEVEPEQVAEGSQSADELGEADSIGTVERVVTRRRVGDDGEGTPVDASEAPDDGQDGTGPAGGTYRPASGGGAEDESAEDAEQTPEMLDPEGVTVLDDDGQASDEPDAEAKGDDESRERNAATERFKDELRRFGEQHADEAREVQKQIGEQHDTEPAEDSQPGQGGGGGSPEQSPLDQESQPGSEGEPGPSEVSASQPADAGQDEEPPPATQPAESDQAEAEQPAGPDEPMRPADQQPPPSEPSAQQPDAAGEATPAEAPEQPEAEPASSEQDSQQRGGESAGPKQDAESEQADSQAGGEPQDQQGQPDAQASDQDQEQTPGGAADEQQQGGADTVAEQPESAEQPDAGPGGRVLPMPQRGPSPPEPPEPTSPLGGEHGEAPAESGQRVDLTDTLELLLRGEDLAEDDLTALAWPLEQKQAFIRDFTRLREAARRAGVLSELRVWRAQAELGSRDVTAGTGLSQDVSAEVAGGRSGRDGLEQIAPPREQRVPPELRAILDAYYRSLAERRARQAQSDVSPPP